MSLSRHLNAEKLIASTREHHQAKGGVRTHVSALLGEGNLPGGHHAASPRYDTEAIPKHSFPTKGTSAEVAYQLIHDELELDGRPLANLASFVHTWMDPMADKLFMENVSKNLIDSDEYPVTTLIHARCISMLAKLWHADETRDATGTATTGSSEAIQLGGLAMKRRWQEKRKAAGKSIHEPGPNIVMGANAQVALEKFARYFDVEARLVPVDESTKYCMSAKRAMEYVDENTIGVFVILGSTYTGTYENVAEMNDLLDEYEKKTGHYVPIHVDAASGGFVAPFATPKHKWDFKIPRVVSINSSGHKYGKAYVGVGWVIWRDKEHLPKDMIFELHYLGSTEYSFSLNFSRPAAPILVSYYNFIMLGFEKYRSISLKDAKVARILARALERSKYYEVVSEGHLPVETSGVVAAAAQRASTLLSDDIEDYRPSLPVVAFKFSAEFKKEYPNIKQKWIQTLLRSLEWIVPNYALPPSVEDVEILRVVVREQFNEDLVEKLISDIISVTEDLMNEGSPGMAIQTTHDRRHADEKRATKHHEGTKPQGHNAVC